MEIINVLAKDIKVGDVIVVGGLPKLVTAISSPNDCVLIFSFDNTTSQVYLNTDVVTTIRGVRI